MHTNSIHQPAEKPAAAASQYKYLWPKPKSVYKQLFVMGRIFPWTIHGAYVHEEEPMMMEEIAADWDIPLQAVREAIAYYESNPPEMQEDRRREEALMEASGMNDPNYKYHPYPKPLSAQEIARIFRE
jgi:uncharacterized protein (DUF433 family)